jgi:hypothetical protein
VFAYVGRHAGLRLRIKQIKIVKLMHNLKKDLVLQIDFSN